MYLQRDKGRNTGSESVEITQRLPSLTNSKLTGYSIERNADGVRIMSMVTNFSADNGARTADGD